MTAALERINNLLQEKATKTELENYTTLTKINQILGDYLKTTDYTIGMNNKVDKVSGKGLSTNDYTTAEKNKLAMLENYDDSALVEQVSQLEQNINTVIGEGATEAIENFKEILDFLAGIADTQTLQGLIKNLKTTLENEIAKKSDIGHTHTVSDITDFTPQVKTLQAADTLDSAPTETTLTHTVNGTTIDYKIGEHVRVPDSESETGFKFFQLHDVTDGKAIWAAAETGSEGSNSNILISTIYIDQTITDPSTMISGDINGAAIQAIRANSHRYLGKYTAETTMTICQLNDANSNQYADGSAANLTGAEGDVFMRLPEFYTKATEIYPDKWQIRFAYGGQPDSTWMKWGGDDLIGVYEAYLTNNKLYSISGVTPSKGQQHVNFRLYAKNRGTGFGIVKHKHRNIMAFLLWAYYGNTCIKSIVGTGTESVKNTGQTNSLGMTDTTSSNGNSMSINAWGLENWWGNLFEAVGNIVLRVGSAYITEDSGEIRIVETLKETSNWYYPSKILIGKHLDILPKTSSRNCSVITGYCDGIRILNNSYDTVFFAGHASNYEIGGPICYRCTFKETDTPDYGTRISFFGKVIEETNVSTFKSLTAIG